MGKLHRDPIQGSQKCTDEYIHICGNECHTLFGSSSTSRSVLEQGEAEKHDVKELLVIGAGPHALTLMLRLLEPDPDFLSDKERHLRAERKQNTRPLREVHRHVNDLSRGTTATLKSRGKAEETTHPPPLLLEDVRNSVLVVDTVGSWLSGWKRNFDALQITQLRSPTNAHADPFDHRSLEIYAAKHGREDELVTLPFLPRNGDFRGPYQAPSTALFHDFHDLLTQAYGIDDIVKTGTVQSIVPTQEDPHSDEPVFEVRITSSTASSGSILVKAKRVVCAMGPVMPAEDIFWVESLKRELGTNYPADRILNFQEIVSWLIIQRERQQDVSYEANVAEKSQRARLLIVGGGITSAQLALLAADRVLSPWCQSVTLIQRTKVLQRQFDIENKWMGHGRGKLLDNFWALNIHSRAKMLKEARGGGSIPPEVLRDLLHQVKNHASLQIKEEVQVSQVVWRDNRFYVALDDGSPTEAYDIIWLATGSNNDIDLFPVFSNLRNELLPVQVVNGLPVLNQDLTWRHPSNDDDTEKEGPMWKQIARKRFWMMGSLAGLELGPDALNLIGARHGAVRVAEAIRSDMSTNIPMS